MQDTPKLLYSRKEAAFTLSISVRALDLIVAAKGLTARRIGSRVLIPHVELVKYSRGDHPNLS